MNNIGHDLHYSFRKLWMGSGFTPITALKLALGIAASTVIFNAADSALLRLFPCNKPERLAALLGVAAPDLDVRYGSDPKMRDWEGMARSFVSVSVYDEATFSLSGLGDAEMLEAETVSAGFFRRPSRGKFTASDQPSGRHRRRSFGVRARRPLVFAGSVRKGLDGYQRCNARKRTKGSPS
jgi:hypothetical protein